MKNKQKGYEDLLGELQNETIDLVAPQMLKIYLPNGEHKYGAHSISSNHVFFNFDDKITFWVSIIQKVNFICISQKLLER
jgi:hypothetical protein